MPPSPASPHPARLASRRQRPFAHRAVTPRSGFAASLSQHRNLPFVQDFELSEPSFISQSKKDRILNFPNEQHPLQAHIVQEIELSESEVAIARATPFGKFKILHQAPSNDASTATSSNETSSKASRTHPRVTLHVPTSRPPPLPRCFRLRFCPYFHLRILPLLPPLPFVPISAFAPPILLALPFLALSLRLSSLLSSPVFVFTSPCFRLCFRAPSSPLPFAPLRFRLRVRACSSPSAAAASPRVAGFTPPGNADLNSHPKAIIPSPSERLSPQSPGRARGPSSTPEQPLDCPLFRQFP